MAIAPRTPSAKNVVYHSLFLLCGFTLALLVFTFSRQDSSPSHEVHLGGYRFINPLLSCEIDDQVSSFGLRNFRSVIQSYIDKEIDRAHITSVSVYYRDLNNGPWFGINPNENFFPSSLLKMPALISVLKRSETDQTLLSKKVRYTKDAVLDITQHFKPRKELVLGEDYTILNLTERMIRFSDNTAANLIGKTLGTASLLKVYKDMGVAVPSGDTVDFMNVKDYSAFFGILFNASYLSKENSEAALELLSSTDFDKGLVAGVPSGITVAHKFGEHQDDSGTLFQLHDCGIIYQPSHPYTLCVMTRGKNFDELASVIKDISALAYAEAQK